MILRALNLVKKNFGKLLLLGFVNLIVVFFFYLCAYLVFRFYNIDLLDITQVAGVLKNYPDRWSHALRMGFLSSIPLMFFYFFIIHFFNIFYVRAFLGVKNSVLQALKDAFRKPKDVFVLYLKFIFKALLLPALLIFFVVFFAKAFLTGLAPSQMFGYSFPEVIAPILTQVFMLCVLMYFLIANFNALVIYAKEGGDQEKSCDKARELIDDRVLDVFLKMVPVWLFVAVFDFAVSYLFQIETDLIFRLFIAILVFFLNFLSLSVFIFAMIDVYDQLEKKKL